VKTRVPNPEGFLKAGMVAGLELELTMRDSAILVPEVGGANAQVVETEVTERLEEAINNIEGIKTLRSESREGVSNISIEFDLSRDIDVAAQDVRDRVSRVRGRLPRDIREPVIAKQDADAQPIIWLNLNSDRYAPVALTTLAEQQIKPRLQAIPAFLPS
jgi:multidrug efflux pump